jgi:pilus assembly protein CpaE
MTLNCVVIGPDRELVAQLTSAFDELGGIQVVRDYRDYPTPVELIRLVRSQSPHVFFLGLKDEQKGFEIISGLHAEFPNLQIAVFHNQVDPQTLLKLMQKGIREYIAPPFDADTLAPVMIRLRDNAIKNPVSTPATNLVYSFLPSKPGSGTTTLAINESLAMAKQPDTRCLLIDLDLNSGLIRFLLKLDNDYSILDAAQHAANMDEALWPQVVCKVGKLDVIHTAKITPGVRIEGAQIRSLLDYARRQYTAICIDLSGNMERYAMEAMQESKTIFIVCTPEIPSLHLAREKFFFLKESGLEEKVSFLLNRNSKHDLLQLEQIEHLLSAKVDFVFPNDYRGVYQAVADGTAVNPASELGKQIESFSYQLLEREMPDTDAKKKKKEKGGLAGLFRFGSSRSSEARDSETKAH